MQRFFNGRCQEIIDDFEGFFLASKVGVLPLASCNLDCSQGIPVPTIQI
jgi:hypothetical protein